MRAGSAPGASDGAGDTDGRPGSGEVADYADLARLGHVSRARVTQIMNLPGSSRRTSRRRSCSLAPSAAIRSARPTSALSPPNFEWRKQRRLWKTVTTTTNQWLMADLLLFASQRSLWNGNDVLTGRTLTIASHV